MLDNYMTLRIIHVYCGSTLDENSWLCATNMMWFQCTELVSEFGQCPRNIKGVHNVEGVSGEPIQVDHHIGLIHVIVGQCEALDNVDEVCEEHTVAVCKVGMKDVLWDIQLVHDNVEPLLVTFLHAGGDGGSHALHGDGNVWIIIVAVCLCKKPDIK